MTACIKTCQRKNGHDIAQESDQDAVDEKHPDKVHLALSAAMARFKGHGIKLIQSLIGNESCLFFVCLLQGKLILIS